MPDSWRSTTASSVHSLSEPAGPSRRATLAHRTQFGPEMLEYFEQFGADTWFGASHLVRVHPAPAPGATLPDEGDLLTGLTG